jgi:AraC-like DNA-binding protein
MLKYEKERSDKHDYLYHQNDENLRFVQHIHKSFEYIYVYEGSLTLILENKEYEINAGQAALILPFQIHSYTTSNYSKSYLCVFSLTYAMSFYEKYKNKKIINPVFDFSDYAYINQDLQNMNSDRYLLKSHFYLIISKYVNVCEILDDSNKNNELVIKIVDYINNNLNKELSLSIVSDHLGYSYHYLSTIFKSEFKIGFSKLINEYRINNACQLLIETDKTIYNIATSIGYESLRTFNRAFIDITKTSPSLFRMREKGLNKII